MSVHQVPTCWDGTRGGKAPHRDSTSSTTDPGVLGLPTPSWPACYRGKQLAVFPVREKLEQCGKCQREELQEKPQTGPPPSEETLGLANSTPGTRAPGSTPDSRYGGRAQPPTVGRFTRKPGPAHGCAACAMGPLCWPGHRHLSEARNELFLELFPLQPGGRSPERHSGHQTGSTGHTGLGLRPCRSGKRAKQAMTSGHHATGLPCFLLLGTACGLNGAPSPARRG